MIAHALRLPDEPLELARLEAAVRAPGMAIRQRALALAWEWQAPPRPPAACGGTDPRCQPRSMSTTSVPGPSGEAMDRRSSPSRSSQSRASSEPSVV